MGYPRIIIASTHSGTGKTTLVMGLILALKKYGLRIQPFKAGPDYIDTSHHTRIAGRACRNLDTWMLKPDVILESFTRQADTADLSIIEGVMGLYDGLRNMEKGSTAYLAKILKSPIILLIDVRSMSRSAAAIALGFKTFDKKTEIKGVILNNTGSTSHCRNIKNAIESETSLPVLGFLPRDRSLTIPERHLGLIPAEEKTMLKNLRRKLLDSVRKNIDIDALIKISRAAKPLPQFKGNIFSVKPGKQKINIAVAKDAAFNFYYQDNLDMLKLAGVNLIEFSPLKEKTLPKDAHGLYIGGGFPELFAAKLSGNSGLMRDIYNKAESGMPVYAECGGLMYLGKKLNDFKNRAFPMVGIFDFSVKMAKHRQALGYVNIEVLKNNILSLKGAKLKAHIFHWSYIDGYAGREKFVYKLRNGHGSQFLDGLLKWNVLAAYSHFHFAADKRLAANFAASCAKYKEKLTC